MIRIEGKTLHSTHNELKENGNQGRTKHLTKPNHYYIFTYSYVIFVTGEIKVARSKQTEGKVKRRGGRGEGMQLSSKISFPCVNIYRQPKQCTHEGKTRVNNAMGGMLCFASAECVCEHT